jgi:hypothetical protein
MITKVEIKNHKLLKDGIYNVNDMEGKLMLLNDNKDLEYEDYFIEIVSIFLEDKDIEIVTEDKKDYQHLPYVKRMLGKH